MEITTISSRYIFDELLTDNYISLLRHKRKKDSVLFTITM